MGTRRALTAAVPAVVAGLLLLAPTGASAASSNGSGRSTDTVEFQAKADSGTEVGQGPEDCQNRGENCYVATSGTADVHAGNYQFEASYASELAINYGQFTVPRAGYYCAPATGTVTIVSMADTHDSITKSEQGQVCGGDQLGASHTFTGSYTITGGSGRFSGATGSGSVRSADDGQGNITSSHEWGTITYEGAK